MIWESGLELKRKEKRVRSGDRQVYIQPVAVRLQWEGGVDKHLSQIQMKRPVKRPIQENTIKPGNLVCAFLKQIKNYSWSIFVTESTSFKLHNFYHLKKLICACFFNVFIKVCTISRAGFTRTAINQKIVIAASEKRKQSWKMKKKFIIFKRTVYFIIQVHMNSNNFFFFAN